MANTTNPAKAGRAGAAKSPWSKGPHASTPKAKASHAEYVKRGKHMESRNAPK